MVSSPLVSDDMADEVVRISTSIQEVGVMYQEEGGAAYGCTMLWLHGLSLALANTTVVTKKVHWGSDMDFKEMALAANEIHLKIVTLLHGILDESVE